MKTTKKALSVLLAVIMIMSSMSVCFGTFSFTASAEGDAFEQLRDALESDVVTKAGNTDNNDGVKVTTSYGTGTGNVQNTVTIETSTYAQYLELKNVLVLMDNAIKATNEYQTYAGTNDDYKTPRNCTSTEYIEDELIDNLRSAGLSVTTNITTFINYVLRSSGSINHESAKDNSSSFVGTPSATHSSVPDSYTNTVIVKTSDYKGYLATRGAYTNVESSIELGYTYSIKMIEAYYQHDDSGWFAKKHRFIHNMIHTKDVPINAPSIYSAASNTSARTDLNNHVTVINNFTSVSFEDLLAKVSNGTIDTFLSDFNTAVTNMQTYVGGAATYNSLFGQFADAVAAQKASIQSAKDMQSYIPVVENIKSFIAANPAYGQFSWGEGGGVNNWGAFGEKGSATHAEMEADYLIFKGYYDTLVGGGSVYDYFYNNGDLDVNYYYNFTDNYKVYYLNDSKIAADEFYNANKDTYLDATTEEQTVLLSQVTGFIDAIPTYQSSVRGGALQVINAIYNEGYGYLLDLQEDLKVEINPYVLYFAENAHKSYADLKTGAVWEKIAEADTNRAGLTAFYNTLTSSRRDQLLGQTQQDANHMIAGLYQLLGNRFTAEVDAAYAVYTELGKPKELDVDKFLKLNAVMLAIEADIMTGLDGVNQGGYITNTTRTKYDEMKVSIIPLCDAFRTTYGFNKYQQTYLADKKTGVYPEYRDLYENDQVKDEAYYVDKTKMNELIDALDTILTSDFAGDLLGGLLTPDAEEGAEFNLGAALSDLIKGALFTDGFINTVVQLLYPLVQSEFQKVFDGLPHSIEYSGVGIDVRYHKTLHDVLEITSFNAFPDLMAKSLPSKYSDNIAALTAAKNNWESAYIRDPETKKLTLKWGVEEQKAKLDAGEITMEEFETFFYNAFADAMQGIKPLLTSLITNCTWAPVNVSNIASGMKNLFIGTVSLQVDLQLGATPNRGYANLLVPIYEALGLKAGEYVAIDKIEGEKSQDVAYVLESILAPIFTFLGKLGEAPVDTILGVLPNLIYSTAFNMIPQLLNMLKTQVTYSANEVSVGIGSVMNGGADVIVGDMLIKEEDGALLKPSMFAGGLVTLLDSFGISLPVIDQATLATLGKLTQKTTQRAAYVYSGLEGTGKAYFIEADKADVGYYLLSYILGAVKDEAAFTNLLGSFMTLKDENGEVIKDKDGKTTPDYEAIAKLKETVYNDEGLNLDAIDVGDAIAAIVELANQIEYGVEEYYWYAGENNTPLGTTAAADIYLNPGNDWTEDKAEYLYNNLENLLNAIFKMANLDINVEGALSDAIGGLFSNKTVTGLAKLLGSLSDLGALLAPKAEEDAPEASEPETVAEGEEAGLDIASILTDLLKNELGIDLSVYAQYANLADDAEIDFGVTDAASFVEALTELLTPLKPVLDFILGGEDLTLIDSAITLHGYKGYDNAIIPLLEALGAAPVAYTEGADTLKLTLDALVGVINKLTTNDPAVANDGAIYTIIDMLPGVIYYLSSNALSQGVDKLLTPVYAILDTIRPIYNLDINELLAGIEVDFDKDGVKSPLGLDIKNIGWNFIFGLLNDLLGLDLSALQQVIYDVCDDIETTYTSASKLNSTWKKGAYNANFSQADMLTVVLSFVLEWATVDANAAKLDELLKTNGIIASLKDVFADVEITYGTPNWMYWFEDEAAFDAYIASGAGLPITLDAIDWEKIEANDWDKETAQYFAENIGELVDIIIGMINKDKVDAEGNALPTTLAALLEGLVYGDFGITVREYNEETGKEAVTINYIFSDETINSLIGILKDLVSGIDETLLGAGYLLDVDLEGLLKYTCEKDIKTLEEFLTELGTVLDTYAKPLVDLLFFGDDIRLAKKSDSTDTIVINGGLGYEKGLAMILEALGCDLPALNEKDMTTASAVLGSLGARAEEILANPVNEILDLLPNLVYFLNANGVGVAIDNILQPVYAILEKIKAFGLEVNLADLIGIDLANLSLANIVEIVEGATGLPLDAAEEILVGFCTGKISKGSYIYKMEAAREDVITILLVVALELISDEDFAAKLDEMLGTDFIAGIKGIFEGSTIEYKDPNWNYMNGIENEGVIEYVNAITSYPNDWTEAKAEYLAENLPLLVDTVIGMVEINGVKYESLSALLKANVNIFTTKTLEDLLGLIKGFLGGIDEELLKLGFILDVKLDKLVKYEVKKDIDTVEEFADELAYILGEFAPGVVEWLLLGRDFELLVKDNDGIEEGLEGDAYITISGAHGYAEGLALLLEALGCENLPAVYDVENLDTAATVKAVLNSLAARIEVIFANPVEEVLNILPNLIYFLDADGVDAVISNTTAALMAIIAKLEVFGIKLNINSLVNLPALMGIEDKYAEGDDVIALNNLTLRALLKALSLMTGLDFTELQNVLVPFALGEAIKYDSVSSKDAYKMVYKTDLDKHDMISVIVTAALKVVTTEGNAAKLDEMIGTEIISALGEVFAPVAIEYGTPDWDYAAADNGTVDAMKYSITYPNNWNEETAQYVTEVLLSDDFDALIAGLIEGGKYASISELLKDKVNVFTSENLKAIVDLIANLIKDIDDELLDAAGLLLNVDLVGLKNHKIPADIKDVKAFAAELSTILSKYAPGVVEWLLLGNDYTFFVESVDENGEPVDFITINGAEGYKKGLAILLEALGCENLPSADGETAAIIEGVLTSLANRIDEILSNPIVEVIDLLPNLFYFLNTNGVAVAVKNTTAALTALSAKLKKLGLAINLDVSKMVDLKALLKLSDDAALSMENLSMAAVLEAVGELVGLNLTKIEDVLVGFALGKFDEEYKSVSGDENAKKMVYADEFDKHDLVTVVANLALITLADDANAEFLKGLVGEDIYAVILSVLNIKEAELKKMSWLFTDKANTGEKFSPMKTSELYKGFEYGPNYTREMAQYIADNFGTFVDNIIKLLGIQINGKFVNSLSELLNNLVGGSVYNSSNVIAIRDALAGILAKIGTLEVEGINVGKYIKAVLNSSLKVNLDAVATVNVPEFTENRDMFVTYLCDVLEPLYPVLEWVLADTDLAFFVDLDKEDFVTLPGAEGYQNGIVLLLEALGCTDLTSPEALKATKGDVMITSILNPLLNRVDEILANPAEEIFAILPNLVYFINSNGVDVVVKNTLNAVYTVLNAIEPIAKIDLYKLIGLDLETLTFEKLLEMLLGNLEIAGFSFKGIPMDAVAELTVGTLETYDSLSAEDPAYRMVYGGIEAEADMVTAILRLLITFATTEGNQKAIVDLLKSIGLTAEGEKYLAAMIEFLATCIADTKLGMDAALYSIYYVYYGVDKGAAEMVKGKDDLSKQWQEKLEELNKNSPNENAQVGDLLTDIFDIIFETDDEGENGVLDNSGVASQGGLTFFQKIAKFFQEIAEFFRNLFSFGKK